jgi:hypothetical protein
MTTSSEVVAREKSIDGSDVGVTRGTSMTGNGDL